MTKNKKGNHPRFAPETRRHGATLPRLLVSGLAAVLALAGVGRAGAGAPAPVFPAEAAPHLKQALQHLNATEPDLGFDKDVGEPRLVVPRLRRLLAQPMDLPRVADEVLAAVVERPADTWWDEAARLLDLPPEGGGAASAGGALQVPATLAPALARALTAFEGEAAQAAALLDEAFAGVAVSQRLYAAATLLGATFRQDDRPDVRQAMRAAGVSDAVLSELDREERQLDPEPGVARHVAIVQGVRLPLLAAAARRLDAALTELERVATANATWPETPVTLPTPVGPFVIGTRGPDVYTNAAALILDPGGDDRYAGSAASADGLRGRPLAVVLDLEGNDTYHGDGLIGPGAALFGLCLVRDLAGDDIWRCDYTGVAAGLYGAARVEDDAGNDIYQAQGLAQAAGYVGFGILHDAAGSDLYDVGFHGQGFAGVLGVGLLVDRRGNDRYLAGGRWPDFERNEDRYLSLAQGFSIGERPYAGGGAGVLVDLEGNDVYEADVYGQGCSYWYALGMLIDRAGNDDYRVYQYGQGSGIHLSSGLLADAAGNDRYDGYVLAQGNAHDYAVGMLIDNAGDDTYTADHYAQGRAINNSFALLLDAAGADRYFARQPNECQGMGNQGGRREYGCLGLLLDLGGPDAYSCGAKDGARLRRPDYGIIYDVKP